jgi:microcin C transport system substrate-binding protein
MKFASAIAAFLILLAPVARAEASVTRTHALAEFTTPKYAEGFPGFDYVNPDAPKGGGVVTAEPGSFDSLNSIILRGQVPRSIGLISDSLFVSSGDELEVVYGLIAETAEYPRGQELGRLQPASRSEVSRRPPGHGRRLRVRLERDRAARPSLPQELP